jgi:hypothetical protein
VKTARLVQCGTQHQEGLRHTRHTSTGRFGWCWILAEVMRGVRPSRLSETVPPFTKAEGAEGRCEGMVPTVFWDAAFNWLDTLVKRTD